MTKDVEIETKLEMQEKLWKSKVQSLEEQYKQTINELRSNMSFQANESQTMQRQYQNRIDAMENSLKVQLHTLEEQSLKLERLSDAKNAFSEPIVPVQALPKSVPVQKKQNLVLVESQETLPPYEDNSRTSDDDMKIVALNKHNLQNDKAEVNDFSNESSSELSNETEQKGKNKDKRNVSHKKLFIDKVNEIDVENKNSSSKNIQKKNKDSKPQITKRNISRGRKSKSSTQIKETDTDTDLEEPKKFKSKKNKKERSEKENFSMR